MYDASTLSFLLLVEEARYFRDLYWPTLNYVSEKCLAHRTLLPDLSTILDVESLAPTNVPYVRGHRNVQGRYDPVVVQQVDFARADFSATWSIERAQNFCPSIKALVSQLADFLLLRE